MTQVDKLGRKLAELEDRLAVFMRAGVGLGRSSFDDGSISSYYQGQLGALFGTQWDGSNGAYAVNGPVPPQPDWGPDSLVEGVTGGIRVRWDGSWAAGGTTVAPMGLKHVEVHVGTSLDFSGLLFSTLKTTIQSARGGEVLIPLPADLDDGTPIDYYVRLVARTDAGRASAPSDPKGPVHALKVRQEDLGFDIAALGGTRIFYGDGTPNGQLYGDLWLKEVASDPTAQYEMYRWTPGSPDAWVELVDQTSADAAAAAIAAQTVADAKAQVFTQGTKPTYAGPDGSAIWIDTSNGHAVNVWDGTDFVPRPLGNGAIAPGSLVASYVLATGTVSASLLESVLVLATTIIAGNADGTHAALKPTGIYVYTDDPLDGTPNEVVRLGTDTNDFFGISDQDGLLIASIDDTGGGNFDTVNVRNTLRVAGRTLDDYLADVSHQSPGEFNGIPPVMSAHPSGYWGPIINRTGIAEVNGWLIAGRRYEIKFRTTWMAISDDDVEARIRMVYTQSSSDTAPDPQAATGQIQDTWHFTSPLHDRWIHSTGYTRFTASVTGRHRFLLTIERGALGSAGNTNAQIFIPNDDPAMNKTYLDITDVGPARPLTGQFNQGGVAFVSGAAPAPPPPPTQQYFTEIGFTNHATFRGNGTGRTDTSDVVQGWDPSGYNGDGYGWYSFDGAIPNITGNVDRVDVYLYFNHWYYNSGGTAIINILKAGSGFSGLKLRGDWVVGGWPKPGGRWVTLPSDWWPFFKSTQGANQAKFISLGPSGGSNLQYYGRASDCRLRIWFTQ